MGQHVPFQADEVTAGQVSRAGFFKIFLLPQGSGKCVLEGGAERTCAQCTHTLRECFQMFVASGRLTPGAMDGACSSLGDRRLSQTEAEFRAEARRIFDEKCLDSAHVLAQIERFLAAAERAPDSDPFEMLRMGDEVESLLASTYRALRELGYNRADLF